MYIIQSTEKQFIEITVFNSVSVNCTSHKSKFTISFPIGEGNSLLDTIMQEPYSIRRKRLKEY